MKTILSINKEFFINVSESIAKYNVNKLNNAPKISNSKDSFDLFINEFDGDLYDTEKFMVMYLNNRNSVANIVQLSSRHNGNSCRYEIIISSCLYMQSYCNYFMS